MLDPKFPALYFFCEPGHLQHYLFDQCSISASEIIVIFIEKCAAGSG